MSKSKTKGCLNRDGATTTNKDWGFIPIPGKGGNTTNFDDTKPVNEIRKEIWKEEK